MRAAAIAGALLLACAPARPGGDATPLRVGTSGDYAPWSFASDGAAGLAGLDVDLARAFAEAEGRPVELVRFRWPELEAGLRAGRFDLAMSGITVRPDRSLVGRFGVPVAESGAVALVAATGPFPDLAALSSGAPRIAVNAGGHLERVTRERFPGAHVIAVADNSQVRRHLRDGRADAVVTDTSEAPGWLRDAPDWRALGPFTRDRKACLVRAEDAALARRLDAWLLAREADCTLAALRTRWQGGAHAPRTASPLPALLAAIDERLSLMPLVADAKRRAGRPVEDPAQEARVLEGAVRSAREEAARAGVAAPDEDAVRGLFRALIAAASALQRSRLAAPAPPGAADPPDLDTALRPALGRIGERIAFLLVRLSDAPPADALARDVRDALRTPGVDDADARAIAEALGRYVRPSRSRAASPASTGSARQTP